MTERRRAFTARLEEPRPYYTPDMLGGLCSECGTPIPAALAGQVTMHPACDPDMPAMTVAYNRAKRLGRNSERQGEG